MAPAALLCPHTIIKEGSIKDPHLNQRRKILNLTDVPSKLY